MSGAKKAGEPVASPQCPDHTRGPSKEELRNGFKKLRRLSWITLVYQVGAAALLGAVAGGSQAVKTEWLENALAIIPPIGVLLTDRFENKPSDERRPFGYHRAGTVAFLVAAFVLAGMGTFLCYDNLSNLIRGERPAIGGFTLAGHTFWHGWLMIGVMALTAVPPSILGSKKTEVAKLLHDKPLHADAEMNRANWMTNLAGIVGLSLVAWGLWWGDALAALIISLDIMRDGWTNVCRSLSDVMDHHPVDIEKDTQEPIFDDVRGAVRALPFVQDERVLLREHGRYLFAEIFIQPNERRMPSVVEASRQVRQAVMTLDWRLQHVAVEFNEDIEAAANVLTREELDIEAA